MDSRWVNDSLLQRRTANIVTPSTLGPNILLCTLISNVGGWRKLHNEGPNNL